MSVVRSFVSTVAFVVLTFIGAVLAIAFGFFDGKGRFVFWLARWWGRAVLWCSGIHLRVKIHASLDPGRPYVFMANHLSMVDIFAALVAVPVSFCFIAKKSLASIPLFGWAMHAGGFIFIDRHNPTAAHRSIAEASRRIHQGQSVVIFPEGTRSRDGKLAPFKKGGFHLAVDSGAEIVPVAIRGSRELMPRGSARIKPGEVSIEIGEPISTEGVDAEGRSKLVDRVRGQVADMLGQAA